MSMAPRTARLLSAMACAALGLLIFFAIVGVFGFPLAVASTVGTAVLGTMVWMRSDRSDHVTPTDRSTR